MKQDEIIEMARQAGFPTDYNDKRLLHAKDLEAFAKLVAAKEREKLKNVAIFDRWYQELDAAVLAEREACAKVCDENATDLSEGDWDSACFNCADHIRARGEE